MKNPYRIIKIIQSEKEFILFYEDLETYDLEKLILLDYTNMYLKNYSGETIEQILNKTLKAFISTKYDLNYYINYFKGN